MKIKITILKKTFYPEYADAHINPEIVSGPCSLFNEGDEFIYTGNAEMPEGFCTWAWLDIFRVVNGLESGANYMPLYNANGKHISCCTDGIRPVIFKVERIEE